MRILCAWCRREGQSGYLGDREPLDNPRPTHGICPYHKAQILESLPSRSCPDAEMLIVVSHSNLWLYEHLRRSFTAMSRVKVILERRVSDRRAEPRPGSSERRYLRTRRVREGTISSAGDFTVVRFTPKVPPPPPAPLGLGHRVETTPPPQATFTGWGTGTL
jgi:hypothetical protein